MHHPRFLIGDKAQVFEETGTLCKQGYPYLIQSASSGAANAHSVHLSVSYELLYVGESGVFSVYLDLSDVLLHSGKRNIVLEGMWVPTNQ